MIEPTEDDVLVKAKQLAHDDGSLWLWNEEEDNRDLMRGTAWSAIPSGVNI
jgi:hypothetical protein